MSSLWTPISLHNCEERLHQGWQGTLAETVHQGAPEKMTRLVLQRTFIKDQSLLKLTNELLTHRDNIAASITKDVNSEIYELNKRSSEEIKLLTSRLLEFLRDIKVNIEKSKCYDDIIPHWEIHWDTTVDQWSCDVRSLLTTFRENVILVVRKVESALVHSRKFTPVQIDRLLDDLVTKLNNLMIVNEKMYTNTERHLKLMFDTLLQGWFISYSYLETATNEVDEVKKSLELDIQEPKTLQKTFKVMDQILEGLNDDEPDFSIVTALKLHLNYLRSCQEHAKLHQKEALRYLRKHLENRQEYITEDANKSQIEELWMEIVTILKEQNDEFKHFSKQSAFAWNQFVKRLYRAENTAVQVIAKLRAQKLSKTLAADKHMNILFDHLRESNSIKNMEQMYDRIMIELEIAELTCVSVGNEEDVIIEQFITATFAASDIFSLHLSVLNENHPNSGADVFRFEPNHDETKEGSDLELIRIKYCVFSAKIWIQGMKESITLLETELPEFLKKFLVNFINVYKGESEYWLTLQLEKISKIKQRVRKNILENRACELKAHDEALKNLHQVIEQQQKEASTELKKIKADLTSNDSTILVYLDQTKTNRLEDTIGKKLKNLADLSLIEKHEELRKQVIKKSKYEMERIFKWLGDYCSTYLHSLRLFHEGGNYSSEECDSIFRKTTKTMKSLIGNGKKNLKRLDHVFSVTRETFKKKLSKIVYPNPTEDELIKAAEREARDRLELCFNRLKEMIKNETYRATLSLKNLEEKIDDATRIYDFQNWRLAISYIESMCFYFGLSPTFPNIELFTVLKRLRESATDSSSQKLSSGSITKSLGWRFSLESQKSKKRKQSVRKKRSRTASRLTVVSELADELFPFNPNYNDGDNYLTNVKILINETYSKLRPILSDAYSKYHVSKEHYTTQRLDAISNLRHYNLQCESVWVFFFKDYINVFRSVYTKTMSYIEMIKNRYIYDSINDAMKLKVTHQANLAKLNIEGIKESIDNKLKTWHGYPLNKPLLQQLLKDVVDHCKGQLTSRKEVNETYRDEVKALLAENRLKAVDVLEDAKFLFVELFMNPTLNSSMEAIWNYYDHSTNMEDIAVEMTRLKRAVSSHCSKIGKERNPKPSDLDYITFTFLEGYKFSDFLLHTKEIQQIMKNMRDTHFVLNENNRKSFNEQYESHAMEGEAEEDGGEDISPHWKKFKEEIECHKQDFEHSAINSLMVAKKDFDRVSWDLKRWKNEWISNVKEVNRLYLINPILDQPPSVTNKAAAFKPTPTDTI